MNGVFNISFFVSAGNHDTHRVIVGRMPQSPGDNKLTQCACSNDGKPCQIFIEYPTDKRNPEWNLNRGGAGDALKVCEG